MNEKMKKLGLLIVAAIAMAMGVNSASALQVADRNNNFGNPVVSDSNKNTVTVEQTDVNTYTITLNDATFVGNITVLGTETVTINLNGKTLSSTIYNNGYLTITGNSSSVMNGTVQNNSNAPKLILEGANFAGIKFNGMAKSTSVKGIGTIVPASLAGYVVSGLATKDNNNGSHTVIEAPANLEGLKHMLNGVGQYYSGAYTGVDHDANFVIERETIYTKSSYAKFIAAYNAAKAVLDEEYVPVSEQARVNQVTAAYGDAYLALELLGNYGPLNNAVQAAMDKLNDGNVWTDATIAALEEAIAAVDYDLPASKNNEIAKMREAIEAATKNLTHKADYSKINDLEAWVDSIGADKFTAESYAVYKFAQESIERDLPAVQQTAVDKYYSRLQAAAFGLKLAANAGTIVTPGSDNQTDPDVTNPDVTDPAETNPGTTNPGTTEGGNNNSGSTVNPNTGATGTTSDVNTSDNVAVYAVMNIASLIALAGCGLVLRKQN